MGRFGRYKGIGDSNVKVNKRFLGVEAQKSGSNGMSVRPIEVIKTDSNETSKRSPTKIQIY